MTFDVQLISLKFDSLIANEKSYCPNGSEVPVAINVHRAAFRTLSTTIGTIQFFISYETADVSDINWTLKKS